MGNHSTQHCHVNCIPVVGLNVNKLVDQSGRQSQYNTQFSARRDLKFLLTIQRRKRKIRKLTSSLSESQS